jgi:hypothetical protein
MKKEYIIQQCAETRWFYKFIELNAKGEELIIEVCKCEDNSSKKSLPKLWKEYGYINRVLETYWSIQTYVKDTEGNSFGRYNPQTKPNKCEINFDWMFEATEYNLTKLIDEVYRLFSTAQGETATDVKYRKVREYTNKNKIELVTKLPKGWQILKNAITAPNGSVWIDNMESFRNDKRKTALLII